MLSIDFLNNEYGEVKSPLKKIEDEIKIEILSGVLKPGQRIVEAKLCEKYKLSRTPLREILRRIEATGLIRTELNRGAFVVGLTEQEIEDCFYLKSILEPQCVKWAIERITDEEFAMLDETFSFMEFYTATDDLNKMLIINDAFNAIIYNASHNKDVENALCKYDFYIRYSRPNKTYPSNYLETVLEEHREIYKAFVDRNPDQGFEAAQTHALKSLIRRR